jgi:hypothetical protein
VQLNAKVNTWSQRAGVLEIDKAVVPGILQKPGN